MRRFDLIPLFLFAVAFALLRWTMVPTLYTFDSAEFAAAAYEPGLAHAPGYPVYLLIAHAFTRLPLALDVAGRVNLLSVLSLSLTAPALYLSLRRVLNDRALAASVSLLLVGTVYVWTVGIVAEVYAPQMLTLALTAAALAYVNTHPALFAPLTGVLFGLAVSVHPGSGLLAPGLAAAFLVMRVGWRWRLLAGGLSISVFALSLLALPLIFRTDPAFNMLGVYTADGSFARADLTRPVVIAWVLRGGQFESLFFSAGWPGVLNVLRLFAANWLFVGVLIGGVGLWVLWTQARRWLIVWAAAFVPVMVFYAPYGAPDVETMLGPAHLLWALPLALGLRWFLAEVRGRAAILAALVIVVVAVNYPLANGRTETGIRTRAESVMAALPQDAVVFGNWFEVVPLEYLQHVEGQRQDVALYNLFLFPPDALNTYLGTLADGERPVFVLGADTTLPLDGTDFSAPVPYDDAGLLQLLTPPGG